MEEGLELAKGFIDLALTELKSLKGNIKESVWRKAVTNIYYVFLNLVRAILAEKGIYPKTHEGVERMFALHFIKGEVFPKKIATYFSNLMSRRAEAEYKFFIEFSMDDVKGYISWLEEALPYFKNIIGEAWNPTIDKIIEDIKEILRT
ncbi:MAG: HEPN domain-containing protein [Nitrospirae bacterium]|nr:HEPN domain-containing protein [Nitrospirota bacterium]